MSSKNSKLSDPYQYDLVSALTQDTLNANLKQFIAAAGAEAPPLTEYYKFCDPVTHMGGTVVMTDQEVQAMTNGQDIFAMPNGTSSQDPGYQALGNAMATAGFAYAFRVGFGLPSGISPAKMPDIISLTPQLNGNTTKDLSQTVQYDMYFASFELMQLTYGWNTWTVQQVAQANNAPWIFQWLVDLNLAMPGDVSFSDLPSTVQNNLKALYNLDPGTMFSLQQLLLDLNTPELVNGMQPSVLGFDPTDPIYTDLNAFVNNYWQPLIASGGITFNSSLTPKGVYPPASLIPTALNFVVSPFSDPSKPGLSTLNYLVMSDGNPMPSPIKPFNWTWVDSDQAQVQGIMAIRRDIFLNYLNDALAPCLTPLCMTVHVSVNEKSDWYKEGDPEVTLSGSNVPRSYSLNANNPCLKFQYESSEEDDQILFGMVGLPQKNELMVSLKVDSNISLNGNRIECETIVSLYYDYAIDAVISTTKGYAMAQKNTTTFTMDGVGVGNTTENSSAGLIAVSCVSRMEDLTQSEDEDKPYYKDKASIWSKALSGGDTKQLIQQVEELTKSLTSLMDNYNSAVSGVVNGSLSWVFPGAQTFFFSNPAFSDASDLTVEISYQSPS